MSGDGRSARADGDMASLPMIVPSADLLKIGRSRWLRKQSMLIGKKLEKKSSYGNELSLLKLTNGRT